DGEASARELISSCAVGAVAGNFPTAPAGAVSAATLTSLVSEARPAADSARASRSAEGVATAALFSPCSRTASFLANVFAADLRAGRLSLKAANADGLDSLEARVSLAIGGCAAETTSRAGFGNCGAAIFVAEDLAGRVCCGR